MIAALRRRFRVIALRTIILAIFGGIYLMFNVYVDLEFCYKIMSQNSLSHMCKKYKDNDYSGSLCEELCGGSDVFKDFKCPQNEMQTIVFTAARNNDVYAVKLARHLKDEQEFSWVNNDGKVIYPKHEEFYHIVKLYITLNYNISLDNNMVKALVNQEINKNNPEQLLSFWRLFKDNNYMMSKLFDDESIFPSVMGSCGPYYATENLDVLETDQSLRQYISYDLQSKLRFALKLMEYIIHLDEFKPEPLKMCKMKLYYFGLTPDKRIKYQTAEYVYVESQVDKRLSNGAPCIVDEDCNLYSCMGKCDREKSICNSIQQNSNMQIFCNQLLKGSFLFPGLLSSTKTPKSLYLLLRHCIDPSKVEANHLPTRPHAPSSELTMRLYHEMKRLYKGLPNGDMN